VIAAAEGSLDLGEILLRQTRLAPEQLERVRALQAEKNERLADLLLEEGLVNADELLAALGHQLDSDEDAPIIRWVNSLFVEAVKERASDIHIQPDAGQVAVRYRIDGEPLPDAHGAEEACCPPSWRA
jgi:type II secretory ATPase GspE/PulE/Tfp pilus assembly ATPase PilB-like protein